MTQVTKGYRYRIYPNKAQADLLVRSMGCARKVWNECLAKATASYEAWKLDESQPKPGTSLVTFNSYLNELKAEYPWLHEVSSVPLQQVTRHLVSAYSTFYKELKKGKIAYPRYKKKGNRNSITLMTSSFRLKEGKLYIAKSKDPLKVKWTRDLPSEPTSCVITQEPSGEYFVSFIVEVDPQLTYGEGKVGIDLGLTDYGTLTDGSRIENPKWFVKSQKRLKRSQQSLSRKVKGSNNRNKARIKVATHYNHVSNQRNDYLHKLSRTLVNENQVISIESLKVKNMVKNHRLSKGISDAAWGMFVNMLEYKSRESQHCQLVRMHPNYPSTRLCSSCGTNQGKIDLNIRKWDCIGCGTHHDRDINAAINILTKGLATIQSLSPTGAWVPKTLVGSLDPVH